VMKSEIEPMISERLLLYFVRRAGILLYLGTAFGCSQSSKSGADVCSDQGPLAFVHDQPIEWADVRILQIGSGVGAVKPSEGTALVDLLWQDSARQKLGFPGGSEARKSRQRVVRWYERQNTLDDRTATKSVEFDSTRLPDGVTLTNCGLAVLKRDRPEVLQKVASLSVR
jgi:hypothetical protein